jgi:hypothetical protein
LTETVAIRSLIEERLERCYGGGECAWEHFYRPRWEWANFATRYHLVYPALAYFVRLRQEPQLKGRLRPQLDAMYRGLLHPRTWQYWHDELGEETWPLLERNLTFAGRLATFVGLYIDTFGEPPAARIELDGRATTYHALSESLWRQAETRGGNLRASWMPAERRDPGVWSGRSRRSRRALAVGSSAAAATHYV